MLSLCGAKCEECTSYKTECGGCKHTQGKVMWTQYIGQDTCPIYKCCQEKTLEHCGGCQQLPCKIWYEIKDPSWSDAEHLHSINERVKLLKE